MAKILIIDDNDSLRTMVARMLEQDGHETMTAENGKKGLEVFMIGKPDLVITDVLMPDMDGVEVISALHKFDLGVKIIVMSGGGDAGTGKDYLDAINTVMNTPHIITKPFEKADLLRLVNVALG